MSKIAPGQRHPVQSRGLHSSVSQPSFDSFVPQEMLYDPFYSNQQRYLANQKERQGRQAAIYGRHNEAFAVPEAQRRLDEAREQQYREERRRVLAQQMMEQEAQQKAGLKYNQRNTLMMQMQEKDMIKQQQQMERIQNQ